MGEARTRQRVLNVDEFAATCRFCLLLFFIPVSVHILGDILCRMYVHVCQPFGSCFCQPHHTGLVIIIVVL